MKILVTGAAGFIGYHTARKLLERGDEVGIEPVPASEGEALGERRAAAVAKALVGGGTAAGAVHAGKWHRAILGGDRAGRIAPRHPAARPHPGRQRQPEGEHAIPEDCQPSEEGTHVGRYRDGHKA